MPASAQISCMEAPWKPLRAKQAIAASMMRWRGGARVWTVAEAIGAGRLRTRMNVHLRPTHVFVKENDVSDPEWKRESRSYERLHLTQGSVNGWRARTRATISAR